MLAWVERVSNAALRLSGARSVHVVTRRGRVHAYELRGRGEGTFVLLHGMGTTATSYLAVARRLLPHARRVLLPDLLAHGRSEVTPLDRDALAVAMREALDTWVDPREPAVFLGTSLGGATALGYAIESPSRVRALVLASPAGAPLSPDELDEIRRRFDLRTREDARRFFAELLHRPPRAFRLLERGLVEQLGSPTVQGFLGSLSAADFLDPASLATLPCPIRVVWGQSDRILPRSGLSFLRTTLPAGTHFEEPAALGHSPHLERPHLVVEHLVRAHRETR
jgi:pimeloyl-ACP methyl ester carboxylesterase